MDSDSDVHAYRPAIDRRCRVGTCSINNCLYPSCLREESDVNQDSRKANERLGAVVTWGLGVALMVAGVLCLVLAAAGP